MIAVNLLPVELRRQERTPLPRQLVIFGSVGINFIGLMFLLTLAIFSIPNAHTVNRSHKTRINELVNHRKVETRYNALVAARVDFDRRAKTIGQIEEERVIWAKKLDQLWDLMPNSIWFASVKLEEPETGRRSGRNAADEAATGSKLTITGYTAGSNIDEVSKFIAALQQPAEEGGEAFFDGFVKIHDPKLEKDGKTFADYNGLVVTKFTITLEMTPRQEQAAPAAPRPAPVRS